MSSKTRIVIATNDSIAMVTDQLYPATGGSVPESVDRISRYVEGLAQGAFDFTSIAVSIGVLPATATLTMTGAATAGQTLSVANVTFTAETSGATGNQYNLSGTVGTQAANIAAAINGSTNLTGIVTASALAGVVTITAFSAGLDGNGLQISAGNTSNMTASSGFSGGSNGTKTVLV